MCPDCYDYESAVLFNAYAADLWRRFTTYLPRQLARRLGITQKRLRALVRIRFVKVAEYQARGVVHFHAVIRLDAPGEDYQPPPPGITADMLCDAIGQAAAAVRLPVDHDGQAVTLGFGAQTDTRIIRHGSQLPGTGQALDGQAVANYIAKYATKTLTAPGLPSQRLRRDGRPRAPALHRPLPADDHHRLAARQHPARLPLPGLGAHARLRRPLPDQIPPLLRHLRPAPQSPHRPPPRHPAPGQRPRRLGPGTG